MYLTRPSQKGRFFLQYYPGDLPSVVNFSKIINSGFLGSSTLQTMDRYNRIDLFAASPLSKTAINKENSDGSVQCSTVGAKYVTCANCCRTTSTSYTCGCIVQGNCGAC
jgi:hypothetical protein